MSCCFSVNKDSPNQDGCQGRRETSGEHEVHRLDHLEQLKDLEVLEEEEAHVIISLGMSHPCNWAWREISGE